MLMIGLVNKVITHRLPNTLFIVIIFKGRLSWFNFIFLDININIKSHDFDAPLLLTKTLALSLALRL